MLVLMKKRIMEEKFMKNGEIYHLWANFEDLYRYKCGTAFQDRTCTGTGAV